MDPHANSGRVGGLWWEAAKQWMYSPPLQAIALPSSAFVFCPGSSGTLLKVWLMHADGSVDVCASAKEWANEKDKEVEYYSESKRGFVYVWVHARACLCAILPPYSMLKRKLILLFLFDRGSLSAATVEKSPRHPLSLILLLLFLFIHLLSSSPFFLSLPFRSVLVCSGFEWECGNDCVLSFWAGLSSNPVDLDFHCWRAELLGHWTVSRRWNTAELHLSKPQPSKQISSNE